MSARAGMAVVVAVVLFAVLAGMVRAADPAGYARDRPSGIRQSGTPQAGAGQVDGARAVAPPAVVLRFDQPGTGLPLDPFLVSLQAGGAVDVATVAITCSGFVRPGSPVSVYYGGTAEQLRLFFVSDGDPVLVVQKPDGTILCNDNTRPLLHDPTISISNPVTGTYTIWAGSHLQGDLIPGILVFTAQPTLDLGTFQLGALVRRPVLPAMIPLRPRTADANAQVTAALASVAEWPQLPATGAPLTATVVVTGILPAFDLARTELPCNGLVNALPDLGFELPAPVDKLTVFVEAADDTTLLLRTPDGVFNCSDDSDGNLNPMLSVSQAAGGHYLVWVGRIHAAQPVTGVLTVTTDNAARATVLERKP